ncbi:MAG: ABC transporter permease [Chloroflexi bacterium]|nr:ABC transporter permease [Chloroflexota bacterium]
MASASPENLTSLVKSRDTDGYPIPADAEWLTALIKPDTQRNDRGLVARIRDESGLYHSVTIGNLEPRSVTVGTPYGCEKPVPLEDEEGFEPPDWCRIGIPLSPLRRDTSDTEQLWLEFIGISRRPIENAPQPTTGSVRIKDISTANAAGELSLLTDFGDIVNRRTTAAGFGDLGARIDPFSETPSDGAVLTWSQPRYGQLKGVRVGTSDDVLRVIGSNWFKKELELEVGDTTRLFLGNRSTTVEFVAFADFFPTFPSASSPYLVADLREVQRIMSIDQTRGADATNELWISAPEAKIDDLADIEDLFSFNNLSARLMQHAGSEITRSRSDALTAAGWNGYLGFGFAAVTTVSILAFIVTGWTTYRLRRLELAVLKSMGMSMRQMLLMIGLEQILIASISLAIGAGIGLMLSAVLLPYLAGKDASTLAPPMVAVVGTQMLGILLGIVATALIASVTWIFFWVRSQHATTVIRAGGAGV